MGDSAGGDAVHLDGAHGLNDSWPLGNNVRSERALIEALLNKRPMD
ncbi:MAG TPA: hypothetical protein VM866_09065 [Pyrinomonadaceae bacterium]|nr:hypothetical protein [Pyrinomonadaceae bacterium]